MTPETTNFDVAVDLVERTLRKAGATSNGPVMLRDAHERAIQAAVLAEREACAALMAPLQERWGYLGGAFDLAAEAIRARSTRETEG